mmetsp:Transcript_17462/g.34758  ORF Transcript_17462/g.34758 Transcript_17462/m.34758 type:complete len:218 (+) Transcript_17462:947-1600(+)
MWSSISLSNSIGSSRNPASEFGGGSSARIASNSESTSISTSPGPSCSFASASFAAIFTPATGENSGTITAPRYSRKNSSSVLPLIPYTSARRLLAATMKSKWFRIAASAQVASTSKSSAWGHRLDPDQKRAPEEVRWSGGKLWRSCRIWLWKSSSKRRRAQVTHCSKVVGRSSTRVRRMERAVSTLVFCWAARAAPKSGAVRYWLTSSAFCLKTPSK